MIIREYQEKDELQWVRCRVLSFLDSAYFDNILREKEHYLHPAVELVAEADDKVVGFIDVEYENEPGDVCYLKGSLGGVIWHLGVLPEYRSLGVASSLLEESIERLKKLGVKRIEAWTRDDKWVNEWYIRRGFAWKESYLHVYAESSECDNACQSKDEDLLICNCYAHYIGSDREAVKKQYKRVHECNLYELQLD